MNPKKQSDGKILSSVKKEMAKPREAESVRVRKSKIALPMGLRHAQTPKNY